MFREKHSSGEKGGREEMKFGRDRLAGFLKSWREILEIIYGLISLVINHLCMLLSYRIYVYVVYNCIYFSMDSWEYFSI